MEIYTYTPQQRCMDAPHAELMVGRCEKDPDSPALQLIITSGATVHVGLGDVVPVVWEMLRLAGDPAELLADLANLAAQHGHAS